MSHTLYLRDERRCGKCCGVRESPPDCSLRFLSRSALPGTKGRVLQSAFTIPILRAHIRIMLHHIRSLSPGRVNLDGKEMWIRCAANVVAMKTPIPTASAACVETLCQLLRRTGHPCSQHAPQPHHRFRRSRFQARDLRSAPTWNLAPCPAALMTRQ